MTLNYLAYTRTVLLSDARVSDARRESLAKRIVRYAKEHGIKDFSALHENIDFYLDGGKFRSRTLASRNTFAFEHPLGEDMEFGALLNDDRVPASLDILALREKNFLSGKELLESLCADAPDILPIAKILLAAEVDPVVDGAQFHREAVIQSLRASLSQLQKKVFASFFGNSLKYILKNAECIVCSALGNPVHFIIIYFGDKLPLIDEPTYCKSAGIGV